MGITEYGSFVYINYNKEGYMFYIRLTYNKTNNMLRYRNVDGFHIPKNLLFREN